MSEKEFSKDGNIPHVPEDNLHEDESGSGEEVQEAEVQEVERHPIETQSRDSGHDSPLDGAIGGSRDSGHDSPLEGAVGGVLNDVMNDARSNRRRIKSGKEDLFRKFFDKEYDQPLGAPILDRRRHLSQRQRVRKRHESEDSRLSDSNPLGCLQDAGTSSGPVLNQAGAIIGKNIPAEEIADFKRFGTEFGQSLPLIPREEGSDRSISSIETARIGDLYGGTFSRPPSDDSRGLSPGSSFPSFSSRPPTDASGNIKTSPPPDSDSPEGDKSLGAESSEGDKPSSTNFENSAEGKPVRQRRFGVVTEPVQIRSKSALAGYSCYAGESPEGDLPKRKTSKNMSVCSEPLPQRKISKDSSVDYEQMSLEDETIHYPELSHSLENDSCLPMPDLDPAAIESLRENLDGLAVSSDIVTDAVEPECQENGTDSEQDPATLSCTPDAEASQKSQTE